MRNINKSILFSIGLAVLPAQAVFAQNDIGEVTRALNAAGYNMIRDIEWEDGLWEADVQASNGRWHDVHVVPATWQVLDRRSDQRLLNADEIVARLTSEGYTRIHDVDLDDAIWEVDARSPEGLEVDLRLNGFDGAILHSEQND
jgi:hypothetical protein